MDVLLPTPILLFVSNPEEGDFISRERRGGRKKSNAVINIALIVRIKKSGAIFTRSLQTLQNVRLRLKKLDLGRS